MTSKFNIADIFTDHMVLQRDTEIKIWRNGDELSTIYIEFCNNKISTVVKNGTWQIELPPQPAGGPLTMVIGSDNSTYTLSDIFIGEVWIAGGQSNMEWILRDTVEAREEIPKASLNNIRFYTTPKLPYDNAAIDYPDNYSAESKWQVCTPQTAEYFSAIAFHFAKRISASESVAIGIVSCNLGGTSASCWISKETLIQDNELNSYIEEYEQTSKPFTPEEYDKVYAEFLVKDKEIQTTLDKVKLGECTFADVDTLLKGLVFPIGPKWQWRPAGVYYSMLKKIIPFATKGVIFYQGESDDHKPRIYKKVI